MSEPLVHLAFEGGTVIVTGPEPEQIAALPHCEFDARTSEYRCEGRHYRAVVEHLMREKIDFTDEARLWNVTEWQLQYEREPFPHQQEGVDTWRKSGARGVVVLPTGTGKTFLAILAIEKVARPTLVVTPTLDLLNQWHDELRNAFGGTIGLLGGGDYDIQPITVTTYQSAYIHLERWGNRFALLVFDECHHLPGESYSEIARGALAPFRLGLTATPERSDGMQSMLPSLIGPEIYRREIKELSGNYLANYRAERKYVELTPEEEERYNRARDQYRRFLFDQGISLGGQYGWQNFIQASCRSTEGRAAFQAYREQKRLALAAPAKLAKLEELLRDHANDRILIFTYDNATVYEIARRFLIPAITHQTKTRERRKILDCFHTGEYPIVVTSQVLNEGVDVPAANVGIILSGTGSVREHVQRLGRLLRKHGDKQAILYEIVTRGTAEEFTSERRRQHHAYQ